MKNRIIILFLVLIKCTCPAQLPALDWAEVYGSSNSTMGMGVVTDKQGNVYTTGYFGGTIDFDGGPSVYNLTSVGGNDVFVSKVDSMGNFVWAKQLGGVDIDDASAIAIDKQENIYITGSFVGTADFDPGAAVYNLTSGTAATSTNIFITKLNSSGNFVWAKQFRGDGYITSTSVVVDNTGNVYTAGWFSSTFDFNPGSAIYNLNSSGSENAFVSKLDSLGNFVWAKKFGSGGLITAVCNIDIFGNIYVTGRFDGTVDFNPGTGVYYLSNETASNSETDVYILKMSSAGNFIWAKRFGGKYNEMAQSISTDIAGNVLTTGYFSDTVDFDAGINAFILISADPGYNSSIFVAKYDAMGNFIWARAVGGEATSGDVGHSVTTDSHGNVFITGSFGGASDFDPGVGVLNLTASGLVDIFLVKLSNFGNLLWAANIGGSGTDRGYGVTVDSLDNLYLTGVVMGTADFDLGVDSFNLTCSPAAICVAKFSGTDTSLTQPQTSVQNIQKQTFNIFPNPTSGVFTIDYSLETVSLEIVNCLGVSIRKQKLVGSPAIIDLLDQASGIYFLKLFNQDDESFFYKIVKN